jgi:hypothetical protein
MAAIAAAATANRIQFLIDATERPNRLLFP